MGKAITEIIVAVLGNRVHAAKMCYVLIDSNYDDWSLTSLEELKAFLYHIPNLLQYL
jgi:hypothetical protein